MTQTTIRLKTHVLPGKRVEFTSPDLDEGEEIELIVLKPETVSTAPRFASALDYLNSLPPLNHTPEEWEQIEREIQEEKDAWER
jgi:hypothetical protein